MKLRFPASKLIIFMVILCSYTNNSMAQNLPRLAHESVKHVLCKGTIAHKYPVTFYLKHENSADCLRGVYAVSGWYYYNKFKTKIPLSGLYDGDLVLYNFSDRKQDTLLYSFAMVNGVSPDTIKHLSGYQEKFIFKNKHISEGTWTNDTKELSVDIDLNKLDIARDNTYLIFDDGRYFNLTSEFWQFTQFEVLAANPTQSKVILSYSHPSNANACGRCGAASEKGIYVLHFSANGEYLKYDDYLTESCYQNLGGKTIQTIHEGNYIVEVSNWVDNKKWKLIVDTEKCEVRKE